MPPSIPGTETPYRMDGEGGRMGKFFGGAAIRKHLFQPSLGPAARVIGHGTANYSQHAALVS